MLVFLFAIVKCLKPLFDNSKKDNVGHLGRFQTNSVRSRCKMSAEEMNKFLKFLQFVKTDSMDWGNFHQSFIGSLPGWKNLRQGHATKLDVMHEKDKIIAELKNSDNTMNSDSKASVYVKLTMAIAEGWYTYLIYINGNVENKKLPNGIHQISGKDFYVKVTKIADFLEKLAKITDWIFENFDTYEELLVACSISEDELVDVIDMTGDLSDLTVNKLKEVIKSINLSTSKKLPVSGTKAVLIERIKKHREGIA